jgi:hypothetical protein
MQKERVNVGSGEYDQSTAYICVKIEWYYKSVKRGEGG